MKQVKIIVFPQIQDTINSLRFDSISKERETQLQPLIDYIQAKINQKESVILNFICTHNSRRSHLSQIWAQTAAVIYNIEKVVCYSGGTEETAMFPLVAETLIKQGFHIKTITTTNNPIYFIKYSENEHPIIGFSKTFDHEFNPQRRFAAIMTCSNADEGCPIILGADKRFPITFEDPKAFDNTPQQSEKYEERSIQIATEMLYVFSKIKK
jgi:arsenate reductase